MAPWTFAWRRRPFPGAETVVACFNSLAHYDWKYEYEYDDDNDDDD